MMTRLSVFILFLIFSIHAGAQAPRITYSEPERDSRRTEFEVIGKVSGNFLVYTNNRNDHDVNVFDNEMNLKQRVNLDDSDRWINVDFISYPDFFYLIYQYQRRNVLYCMALKLDGNGRKMAEPMELDTTH